CRYTPEFIGGKLAELVELDLFREDIKWYVDGSPEPPAALVIVKDGVERGAVPIEKILVPERVEISDPPRWVAEQRVRELVQRSELGFEPQPAHL
ncbi:unnamed protein product, partial [Nesidiocoris tenuis]